MNFLSPYFSSVMYDSTISIFSLIIVFDSLIDLFTLIKIIIKLINNEQMTVKYKNLKFQNCHFSVDILTLEFSKITF